MKIRLDLIHRLKRMIHCVEQSNELIQKQIELDNDGSGTAIAVELAKIAGAAKAITLTIPDIAKD